MKVAWFGVEATPSEIWLEPLILARVSRFAILNWGDGLVIAVPARERERFRAYAEWAGWRLTELLEPPEVRPCVPWPIPKFPALRSLGPKGGVLARRADSRKWLVRFARAHTVIIAGRPVQVPWSEEAERARASAYNYGCVFKAVAFTFAKDGSRKLAERVERLKAPRFLAPEVTPLELAKLTEALAGEGYRGWSLRSHFDELRGIAFRLTLADGHTAPVEPGRDNSMFLCGAPESGKSVALDFYLAQVPEAWNVIVIDPTGEHAVLGWEGLGERRYAVLRAGVDVKVNPLALGEGALDALAGVLESLWRRGEEKELTAAKIEVLRDAVANATDLWDVYRNVAKVLEGSAREDVRSAAFGLKRRLEPMIRCPALYGGAGEELPRGRVVVVTRLGRGEAELAFIYTVLHMVYAAARQRRWSGIVAIDEIELLGNAEILNRICDELRKYGVSVWAAGHSVEGAPEKLLNAKHQLYFATTDPATLRLIDPRGAVLPRLKAGQALYRARGWGEAVVAVTAPRWMLEARRAVRAPPEIPVSTVAARYGVEPPKLAMVFSREACEALHRFARGEAATEDLALLADLGLRTRGELTRLGLACLELCREAQACPEEQAFYTLWQ